MNENNKRIFGLDLMRCIAILLVLIAHTFTLKSQNGFLGTAVYYAGIIGVELFFVLSGFLIGTILIKIFTGPHKAGFYSIKGFWVRRWFRTLPNYYLVILIYNLLYYRSLHDFAFSFHNNANYLFFMQNFFSAMPDKLFQVSWSLGIEEWFYLLFPLFILAFQYIIKNKQVALLTTILFFIAVPLLLRIFFSLSPVNLNWDQGFRKITPLRLDAIGIGVLLSYLQYYYAAFLRQRKGLFFKIGLSILLLLLIFFYIAGFFQKGVLVFMKQTIFFTIFSVAIALLIPYLLGIKGEKTNRYIGYTVTFISLISYSIYLLHPIIIQVVQIIDAKYKLQLNAFFFVTVIWLLTMVLSYFQYRFFENKITNLRDKLGSKNSVTV